MKNRQVLYLTYDGLTDPLGQSQILPYLLGLCDQGYHFHIISFEKTENLEKGKSIIEESIKQSEIAWYPLVYHKNPPILSTVFDLWKMFVLSKKLISKHNIELVHSRSYPPGLIGSMLKKKLGIKFLFDIRGFWANERVDGGIWRLRNPIYWWVYKYFKKKEIEMMELADHIICLTHAGKEEIVSGRLFERSNTTGISESKIAVIPCAVDPELFDQKKIHHQDKIALKSKLGLEDVEQIYVYLGSLGTWYLLEEMLMYFKEFQLKQPSSKFLFVTKDDPNTIYDACNRLGLEKSAVVITSSSRENVPLHLSVASKGIFFIKPAFSKKASSATKMAEMLAMGLDIVCNEIGDIRQLAFSRIPSSLSELKPIVIRNQNNQEILESYKLSVGIDSFNRIYDHLNENTQ